MFPGGMSPKKMEKMMKRMGIKMDEVDAEQVVIRGVDRDIIIDNPQVIKTNVSGQEMFQVTGDVRTEESDAEVSINEDDVKMVAEQANVSEGKAREALEESEGDIADAIMRLKG